MIELSLSELPEATRRAFYSLGAFAAKPARFDLDAAKAVAECDLATLVLLVSRNLLENEGKRLSVHPTLADVARLQLLNDSIRY